jgi:hypothetical protein
MSNRKLPLGKALPVRVAGIDEGAYTEDDGVEYREYLKGLSDLADEIASRIKSTNDDSSS